MKIIENEIGSADMIQESTSKGNNHQFHNSQKLNLNTEQIIKLGEYDARVANAAQTSGGDRSPGASTQTERLGTFEALYINIF